MIWAPIGEDRNLLYALSWNYAQDAKVAFDVATRTAVDLNPAAERLMGRTRGELLGLRAQMLHPAAERERAMAELEGAIDNPSQLTGFHVQHRDGHLIPVLISSSETWMLSGRMVLICVYRDITDQVEKERRLAAQHWALSAYADAASALAKARSAEGLLKSICEAIARESAYLAAWVGVAEDGPGKPIRVAASAGQAAGFLDGLSLSWSESDPNGRGTPGECIRTRALKILDDTESPAANQLWRERAAQFGIRSSIAIPLDGEIGWTGALVVYAGTPNAFEGAPVEVFQRLAEGIAHGLRALNQERLLRAERQNLARTQAELTLALSGMVGPIITAMEMRDPYTAGHQGRVAEIACAIGREMGWPEEQMHGLRLAALVHDIGKISIPSEILTKPGKLNAAEKAMICLHPEIGYAILKDVPFAWPVAQIVRQHHEKLDGSGYPDGLMGDQILPEAKVLAVADVVEAMASFRPYRPGIELAVVLRQIESEAGAQLDALAVATCVNLFRDQNFTVPGWLRQEPVKQELGMAALPRA